MKTIQNEPVIQAITAAVFVPAGSGAPVHINRKAHGLAFNVNHTTTYRFSTGQVLTCHSGECVYLPKGSSYTVDKTEVSADPAAGVYAINFYLCADSFQPGKVMTLRDKEGVLREFRGAHNAWRQKAPGFHCLCLSRLYRILSILLQEQAVPAGQEKHMQRLAPALAWIDGHYTAEEISLAQLAQLCGVSQPYLRRLFHRVYGVAPAVYIRNRRLSYAGELLRTGEYSVTQAAVFAGFNDAAYFSREFKTYFGMTPSEYSKQGG